MSAGALAYVLIIGTLAAVACWAVEGVCRSVRRAARWAWALGLLALGLAAARAIQPSPVVSAVRTIAMPAAMRAHSVEPASRLAQLLGTIGEVMAGATRDAIALLPKTVVSRAGLLWVIASLVSLAAIVLTHLRVTRGRRTWPLAELHGHDVRIAPALGPAVLGTLKPFIVVPRWFLDRSSDEQRLVLVHEAEHVRARDHLLLTGAWLVVALVPWHPAAWWMLARLRLAIELDCDARVLRRGVEPRVYGTLLIDLAGHCAGHTAGATALADERSHLERRLLAMKPIASRHVRLRAGALLATGLLAILAACEAKMPTSAEVEKMDVAGVERSAAAVKVAGAATTYYVDGVLADEATAHAIAPARIATVNVMKQGDGTAEVRIVTLADGHTRGPGAATGTIENHHLNGTTTFTGILLLDGVRVDPATLKTLDPGTILNVEVTKGAAAQKLFDDPAAVNGVIKVTTKAGAKRGS